MATYLIDENLPLLPFWDNDQFIHISTFSGINSHTDIWQYALEKELTIVT